MTNTERKSIISTASKKIFGDFLWLKRHTNTPYASSEYVINDKYSIFAFEEFDEEDKDDRWITVTMERYNSDGRCVDDFVVTAIANTISRQSLSASIRNLFDMFEAKTNDLDLLKPKKYYDLCEEDNTGLDRKCMQRIHWLFDQTDFSSAQIASLVDVNVDTIKTMRKEWAGCAL